MKKFFNISFIAALAVLPFGVNADVTTTDPGATNTEAPSATYAPKYNLAQAGDNDSRLVTAGYVKGAYNAAIKAINKVSETSVNAASQTFDSTAEYDSGTLGEAIQNLQSSTVTQAGVIATIDSATATASGVSLTVNGVPTGTVASVLDSGATMSGTVNMPTSGTVNTLTVWGNDSSIGTANVTLNSTSTSISGTVTGTITSTFTGSSIDSGTATGNITGIDVSAPEAYVPGV